MASSGKKFKPSWLPTREKHARLVDNSEFYNSIAWRKFSRFYKDKHPLCVACEKEGIVGPAEVADHIQRIEDGGEKFDENNIQSLCNSHHAKKSGRESNAGGIPKKVDNQ